MGLICSVFWIEQYLSHGYDCKFLKFESCKLVQINNIWTVRCAHQKKTSNNKNNPILYRQCSNHLGHFNTFELRHSLFYFMANRDGVFSSHSQYLLIFLLPVLVCWWECNYVFCFYFFSSLCNIPFSSFNFSISWAM